jgi:chromosome segregation ATPase
MPLATGVTLQYDGDLTKIRFIEQTASAKLNISYYAEGGIMDVQGDTGGMDSAKMLDYITKQFPGELATLIATRDELAKRQGALSAVNAANADRTAAAKELADAKEQAAGLLSDAKEQNAAAKAKKTAQDIREKELNARETDTASAFSARDKELSLREKQVQSQKDSLDAQEAKLFADSAQLASDRAALEARIKAFQDKVASINI